MKALVNHTRVVRKVLFVQTRERLQFQVQEMCANMILVASSDKNTIMKCACALHQPSVVSNVLQEPLEILSTIALATLLSNTAKIMPIHWETTVRKEHLMISRLLILLTHQSVAKMNISMKMHVLASLRNNATSHVLLGLNLTQDLAASASGQPTLICYMRMILENNVELSQHLLLSFLEAMVQNSSLVLILWSFSKMKIFQTNSKRRLALILTQPLSSHSENKLLLAQTILPNIVLQMVQGSFFSLLKFSSH